MKQLFLAQCFFVIFVYLKIDADAVKISFADVNAEALNTFCCLPIYLIDAHISVHIFCCVF